MIWEFHKYESRHGKSSTAYSVALNGARRSYIFCNNPKKQRKCVCKKCNTIIPRAVPRLKFDASYHYGAGYYCLSCGMERLRDKKMHLQNAVNSLQKSIDNMTQLEEISEEVMLDPFYEKLMALHRMLQVIAE